MFSQSVAAELADDPALTNLTISLGLDRDEVSAAIPSIGSAVLGGLVGATDAHRSVTPLADALLITPYESLAEALANVTELQSAGNDLLDGLFRDKRGRAVIAIARESGVATSAVGRLFPFIAPTIVAGLRAHVRRTGLSAEGLLAWIQADLGHPPASPAAGSEPEPVSPSIGVSEPDAVAESGVVPDGAVFGNETENEILGAAAGETVGESVASSVSDTDESVSIAESLASIVRAHEESRREPGPESLAEAVPDVPASPSGLDLHAAVVAEAGPGPSPELVTEPEFDFGGRAIAGSTLAQILGELTEVDGQPSTDGAGAELTLAPTALAGEEPPSGLGSALVPVLPRPMPAEEAIVAEPVNRSGDELAAEVNPTVAALQAEAPMPSVDSEPSTALEPDPNLNPVDQLRGFPLPDAEQPDLEPLGAVVVPVEEPDPVVEEYRDIDHLREHGEKEAADAPPEFSKLAWLWWAVGAVAVVLMMAMVLALAGS
jgi:hypothetical protein